MSRRDRRSAATKNAGSNRDAATADDPGSLCDAGIRHMRAKRNFDAVTCCKKALAIDPNHADALHLMGLLSLETNHPDLAVEWIASAIKQSPKAEYLSSLGAALQRQGRRDEALKALDKAVQLKPDDAVLWTNLGVALEELERPSDAVLSFQHALKLDPRHWEAACRSAVLLHRLGRLQDALVHYDLCDELLPREAAILASRALVLRGLKRFEEYLADS
jgi:tetratricopeptide (TPR) repeat protein